MAKVMLTNAEDTENWDWEENPVNEKEYDLDDIPAMYGYDFFDEWEDLDDFIDRWAGDSWSPEHGKWIIVEGKEDPNA